MFIFILWFLFSTTYENYMENDPTIQKLRQKLVPVFPEINHIKLMKGNSSYTINKKKIYICTEKQGQIYNDNMLTYVILHELAHTLSPDIGHNHKFMLIFKALLERAERHGLYNPSLPRVENYCKT